MREAEKTNAIRGKRFLETYCVGRVIDIGCGSAPVTPQAERFDTPDGDANRIDELRPIESYDCVHASHCLEHMIDARDALTRWWRLVKPGGYLIVVVPDETLYEQGVWPSRFNNDHKWSFRLGGPPPDWSPVSLDIGALTNGLPGASILSAKVQAQGYDPSLHRFGLEHPGHAAVRAKAIAAMARMGERQIMTLPLMEELIRFLFDLGLTVDQTLGAALAQIQVVAQKDAD